MRRLITGRLQRELLTSLLLVAIAFRAPIRAHWRMCSTHRNWWHI
jgi:hypothetical protein